MVLSAWQRRWLVEHLSRLRNGMFILVLLSCSLSESISASLLQMNPSFFSIRRNKRELTRPSTDHGWNPALQFCSTTHWWRWGKFNSNVLELLTVCRCLTRCSTDHVLLPACWCRYREDELRLLTWKFWLIVVLRDHEERISGFKLQEDCFLSMLLRGGRRNDCVSLGKFCWHPNSKPNCLPLFFLRWISTE